MPASQKTFKKTSTDEVRELYRHGIVHGMLTNYDNEYVGAKAWNRLCAVRDWATSMRKASGPPKPRLSFMETMRKIDHNRRTREALDAWAPSEVNAGGEGFDTDEVVVASRAYLDGWMKRNYGAMGTLVAELVAEHTPGKPAWCARPLVKTTTAAELSHRPRPIPTVMFTAHSTDAAEARRGDK